MKLLTCQHPPTGDWRTWVLSGGRGSGKTVAASAFVASSKAERIALVGIDRHFIVDVLVQGFSGIRFAAKELGLEVPRLSSAQGRIEWSDGRAARFYSFSDIDAMRGGEFDLIWADEFSSSCLPRIAGSLGMTGKAVLTVAAHGEPSRKISAAMTIMPKPIHTSTIANGDAPLQGYMRIADKIVPAR